MRSAVVGLVGCVLTTGCDGEPAERATGPLGGGSAPLGGSGGAPGGTAGASAGSSEDNASGGLASGLGGNGASGPSEGGTGAQAVEGGSGGGASHDGGGAGELGQAQNGGRDGGGGGSSAGGSAAGGQGQGGLDAGSSPDEAVGPAVQRDNPQLFSFQFTAREADPAASGALGRQHAYLDTRIESAGKLVVYLHGAGQFGDCGGEALWQIVSGLGYHWFGPCFLSDYGVDNCGDDIGGCRLEALEGVDHHPFLNITRPDSIEERIVRGLMHLANLNPEGDWSYFVAGDQPRWEDIIITGHSHGASTSGIIGMTRPVARVVMLAGPYDPGQNWLNGDPATAPERFFGFSHTGDGQHQGHLAAFEALGLPGAPTSVDGAAAPYGDSHRLYSSANVGDAHGSVTSGTVQAFIPVWEYLYAVAAP